MDAFIARHAERIVGTLEGFDRLLFQGTLPSINNVPSLKTWMHYHQISYRGWGDWIKQVSERIMSHAQALAKQAGRPFEYLSSTKSSKEDYARAIQRRDGITEGLVCVLSCVESCTTYGIRGERAQHNIHMIHVRRKRRHLYFYYIDRDFGWMFVRIQTWLPFPIQVYVNGREYLARQMDRVGIGYTSKANGFTAIADLPKAQALLEQRGWGLSWLTMGKREKFRRAGRCQ